MPKLVSILIPAYNSERWISETIESALNQRWQDKEIIIVDDGSSDNTLKIARNYESKILKVVTQKNSGACSARNKALNLSQGDYVQWLDADDFLDAGKISQQINDAEDGISSRVLLTAAFGTFYYRRNKAIFNPNPLWQDLEPLEWILTKFTENVWFNPTSWLVSRKLTELAGSWDERLSKSGDDDGEYICRIVKNCDKVRFVPESKCYYRIGNLGGLNWSSSKAIDSLFLSLKLSIEHLLSLENSPRTKQAGLKYLQIWYDYFYYDNGKSLQNIQDLAKELGGQLKPPKLKWKYLPFKLLLGDRVAKNLSIILIKAKMTAFKEYDCLMYNLQQFRKVRY